MRSFDAIIRLVVYILKSEVEVLNWIVYKSLSVVANLVIKSRFCLLISNLSSEI